MYLPFRMLQNFVIYIFQLHFERKIFNFDFIHLKGESVVIKIFPTKREALLQLHIYGFTSLLILCLGGIKGLRQVKNQ